MQVSPLLVTSLLHCTSASCLSLSFLSNSVILGSALGDVVANASPCPPCRSSFFWRAAVCLSVSNCFTLLSSWLTLAWYALITWLIISMDITQHSNHVDHRIFVDVWVIHTRACGYSNQSLDNVSWWAGILLEFKPLMIASLPDFVEVHEFTSCAVYSCTNKFYSCTLLWRR